MKKFKIPDRLITLIKSTMEDSQNQVKIKKETSYTFRTIGGLRREGDSL